MEMDLRAQHQLKKEARRPQAVVGDRQRLIDRLRDRARHRHPNAALDQFAIFGLQLWVDELEAS